MKKSVTLIVTVVLCVFLCAARLSAQQYNWYKGHTHTHTLNSDGDSHPWEVVDWYKNHGYNFLMITDHNFVTEIRYLDTDPDDDFLLIYGQEVTDRYDKTNVHLNCFGPKTYVPPQHGNSVVDALQRNIDAIREVGGIPQINHPNWTWAFTHKEMRVLEGCNLFEIYNPNCNYFGGLNYPGMEEIWDGILSYGTVMYGVAVDDMHNLSRGTGFGWVAVRARELTPEAILKAMDNGEFYSSTGVEIEDYSVTPDKYEIKIKQRSDWKYVTCFIGYGGKELKKDGSLNPVYRFIGDEKYVRAIVMDSNGYCAWLQPRFLHD